MTLNRRNPGHQLALEPRGLDRRAAVRYKVLAAAKPPDTKVIQHLTDRRGLDAALKSPEQRRNDLAARQTTDRQHTTSLGFASKNFSLVGLR